MKDENGRWLSVKFVGAVREPPHRHQAKEKKVEKRKKGKGVTNENSSGKISLPKFLSR